MSKTVDDAVRTMIANLEAKTGKSLDAWVALVRKQNFDKHKQIVDWLKAEHGLGHGYANLVGHSVLKGSVGTATAPDSGGALVDAQYDGPRAGMRPIYDKLITEVTKFGKDVEIAPKNTYVSLRRSKQFGLVQASTKDRVDVGITLKGVEPAGRLEKAGSFNAMVSHRVRVTDVKQVDKELVGWLKAAYEKA